MVGGYMSLFRPLNEGKRVSYKKYMGIGAGIGAAKYLGTNAYYNHKYGSKNNPLNQYTTAQIGLGGAINGAVSGGLLAFARNHSKKIDNILRLRSPFRRGIEYDRMAAAAKANQMPKDQDADDD